MHDIFLCANAFKGTLSATEANGAIKEGLSFLPDTLFHAFPIADGGDGTLSSLLQARPKEFKKVRTMVYGIQKEEECFYLVDRKNTAYIALCETSGLAKTEERLPERRTTLGFGEQIKEALDRNIRSFVLFLGGSSSTDLGCGMLAALGVKFIGHDGPFLPSSKTMEKVEKIDASGLDKRIQDSHFVLATDTSSPLLGKKGAVYRYAQQKGTPKEELPLLERIVERLSREMEKERGISVLNHPGAAAAGGVGFSCLLYLKAEYQSGAKAIIDLLRLPSKLRQADLVFLGEGNIDLSSLEGKATGVLAKLCEKKKIPFVTVSGKIEGKARERLRKMGLLRPILLGKPTRKKAGNKDKIITAVSKERSFLESFFGLDRQGGKNHE